MAHFKYLRIDKSSVSQRALENKHKTNIENLKCIKHLCNKELDALESLKMFKCKNNMNSNRGHIRNSPQIKIVNFQWKKKPNKTGAHCLYI